MELLDFFAVVQAGVVAALLLLIILTAVMAVMAHFMVAAAGVAVLYQAQQLPPKVAMAALALKV
jgi:hypothetical protein